MITPLLIFGGLMLVTIAAICLYKGDVRAGFKILGIAFVLDVKERRQRIGSRRR